MQKYKMTIAYDGTRYCGWQIQPNGVTIQEVIERALHTILKKPTRIAGSGRTDAGVHAKGQVAHFQAPELARISHAHGKDHPHPSDHLSDLAHHQYLADIGSSRHQKTDQTGCARLQRSLNGLLPNDIRIISLEPVPDSFHARFSAKRKIYHYHLHLSPVHDPLLYPYRYHVLRPFSIPLAKQAALHFIGNKDFTSFSNQANRGAAKTSPVKTLYRIDFVEEPGGLRLEFEGNGFLYKMVRNIVGTLLRVGSGKLDPDAIPSLLEAKNRSLVPTAAVARGLFLIEVLY